MWAENAWDISQPQKLLAIGFLIAVVGAIPYLILVRLGVNAYAAGLWTAGLVLVVSNWHSLPPHPLGYLAGFTALGLAAHLLLKPEVNRLLLVVLVAVLLVAPAAQTVLAHINKAQPYPITDLSPRVDAVATGVVEDVLILIVDSYPSLFVAEHWYGNDTDALTRQLTDLGFTVEETAWSQHTFTGLTLPALLELRPVIEPGPKGNWGNRLSTYRIVRGANFVADSLRTAGFTYTHVESGWDGGSCGHVDRCISSTWLDEAAWELLLPSAGASLLLDRYGHHSVGNSLRVLEHLQRSKERFGDGHHDYVFAHIWLPHVPYVVDRACNVARRTDQSSTIDELKDQLYCADRLISEAAELAGGKTAVVITGDHGMATLGQIDLPPAEWSDAQIAERLGTFLAYRLPEGCEAPSTAVNTDVVRSALSCAIDVDLPDRNGAFFIGADEPLLIEPAAIARIQDELKAGRLDPDS